MSAVLILSSFVAANRVGGSAQVAQLERMGVVTRLAPTVVFGRHPGLGSPGGGPIPDPMFEDVLAGIEAAEGYCGLSAMIAGYFASPGQVSLAARTIDLVRNASPTAIMIVDPIMGDEETGPYVSGEVADAITRELVPRADVLTPNAWELARLTGLPVTDLASARTAALALGHTTLVSSIPLGAAIGVMLVGPEGEILARHTRAAVAPKGTGDLLTALFTGALVEGSSLSEALADAVAEVAALVAGEAVDVTLERLHGDRPAFEEGGQG